MAKEGMDLSDDRLARIEDKVDRLSDAITSLARIEERMITLFRNTEKQDEAISALAVRVNALERVYIQKGVISGFLDKVFWVILGGAVAYFVKAM